MAGGGLQPRQKIIRFGEFELDFSRQVVSRNGVRLKLQKQPFLVLALLIQRAPEVVSRDEIQRHVWGEDVYVDVEQSINFCIRHIRGLLLDSATNSRFIQTVPREGYRFIAQLEHPIECQDAAEVAVTAANPVISGPAAKSSRRYKRIVWIAITGLAIIAVLFWRLRPESVITITSVSPVTNYPGDEREPSISPDGRQVAFSWNAEGSHRHIYATLLGEQHPLRLTQADANDSFPAWSPDGKQIAFVRRRMETEADIMLIPSIGGPERFLHRIQISYAISEADPIIAWTPNGKWLCFTTETDPDKRPALFVLSIESGSVRALLPKSSTSFWDSSPAFSPDGNWLVFARFSGPLNNNLMFQRLTASLEPDGPPLLLSGTSGINRTPVWLPDSKRILFVNNERSIMQARAGRPARLVYAASATLGGLAYSDSGSRLVVSRAVRDLDIWTLPVTGLTPVESATRIVHSTANESQPRFSPDGRWLAFTSDRSGSDEVWLADSNGDNPRQLTHIGAYVVGYPHWSPDSTLVAFHARLPEEPQIYTVRVIDGLTQRITSESPGFVQPSFSIDGKTIYMLQPLDATGSLYRVPLASGKPQRLWLGDCALEAPGRSLLVYSKRGQSGIFSRSLSGNVMRNPEIRLLEDKVAQQGGCFEPVDDGIYYIGRTSAGTPRAFRFYSFTSGNSVDIAPTPHDSVDDVTVTPDRKRLAYVTYSTGGQDLVQLTFK